MPPEPAAAPATAAVRVHRRTPFDTRLDMTPVRVDTTWILDLEALTLPETAGLAPPIRFDGVTVGFPFDEKRQKTL